MIVPGSYQITSYDISTGEPIWRVGGLTYQVKSVPVLSGDRLYFNGLGTGRRAQRAAGTARFCRRC